NEILNELQVFAPKHTETELRSILGCFLFTGDDVFKKIRVLSGGEKSRVALAKALTADANFLVLDEPTNHLDIQSVNILIQALQQYEGTFITVSHDRYFLDSLANKIWFIEDQQIKEYPGTYAEYEEWQSRRPASQPNSPASPKKEEPKPEPKNRQNETDDKSRQLKKLNQELQLLEEKIADLEKKAGSAELKLADESIYSDSKKLEEANTYYQEAQAELRAAQSRWEELADQILILEN